jgi:hypothetical protein
MRSGKPGPRGESNAVILRFRHFPQSGMVVLVLRFQGPNRSDISSLVLKERAVARVSKDCHTRSWQPSFETALTRLLRMRSVGMMGFMESAVWTSVRPPLPGAENELAVATASLTVPATNRMPPWRRIWRKTLSNFDIGVASETRRGDKITRLTALLLQMRACEGYGRLTQRSVRLRGGPMKSYRGYSGFVGGLSSLCRPSLRRLQASAIALLLLLPLGAGTANAVTAPASGASGAHVYLLRGVLNIFSLGLDEIAAKLQRQGIPVTIANYLSYASIADEAAAEYRSGRVRTIILVGHSSGATVLPDMVARLDQLGAPVKLAIGLDSVFRTSLQGRVGRYINFYIANGAGTPVARTAQLRGTLENVDVENVPGVGHITIDKNEIMQQKVISAIDAVVFNRLKAAPLVQRPQLPGASAAKPRAVSAATLRN